MNYYKLEYGINDISIEGKITLLSLHINSAHIEMTKYHSLSEFYCSAFPGMAMPHSARSSIFFEPHTPTLRYMARVCRQHITALL